MLELSTQRGRLGTLWAVALCVLAAVIMMGVVGGCGALEHMRRTEAFVWNAELDLLRTHSERTHRYLQGYLRDLPAVPDLPDALAGSRLRVAWENSRLSQPKRLYEAVIDPAGQVAAHSEPGHDGQTLEKDWAQSEAGVPDQGIMLTASKVLANGRRAYDLSLPLVREGREIATYHAGIDADRLDGQMQSAARQVAFLWAAVITGMSVVVVITSTCVYTIVRNAALAHELEMAHLQRSIEQNELARGLAHEIRNPLNAVRLNLHIFERFLDHPDVLSEEEVRRVLSDSLRETMQIEILVSELLGYVRATPPHLESVELGEVATAALDFFRPSCVDTELVGPKVATGTLFPVCGDQTHFRQVVLNLLRSAREAAGPGGRIELTLAKDGDRATLAVADNGPAVPKDDLAGIFEPFFSGRARNLGLSLALVRKHVQEAGGRVWCESEGARGAKFCVQLPLRET